MAKQKQKSNKLIYWLIGAVVVLLIFIMVGRSSGMDWKTERAGSGACQSKTCNYHRKSERIRYSSAGNGSKIAPEVSRRNH